MSPKIIVIAHNLRSSHNVGSLLRTCDGIQVEKIFLSGYTPYPASDNDQRLPHLSRKIDKQIDKTALGAHLTQNWEKAEDINEILKRLEEDKYILCALEQSPASVPLQKFEVPNKVALIVGNEVSGLDQAILDKAGFILEIPMYGKKESYNVVQALAMALYSFRFAGK